MSLPGSLTSISNDVLSTTLSDVSGEIVDGLFQRTPLLNIVRQKQELEQFGFNKHMSISVRDPSVVTNFQTGREAIDLTTQDTTEHFEFRYHSFAYPVQITDLEARENSGPKAIIDLAEKRYKESMSAVLRLFNRQLVVGGTDISGIGTFNGDAAEGGFIAMASAAAQLANPGSVPTVGGRQRDLAPVIRNHGVNSGGTFALSDLWDLEARIAQRAPEGGDGSNFHIVLCSREFYVNYRATLQPNERYIDASKLDGMGPMVLAFGGNILTHDIELDGVTVDWLNVDGSTAAAAPLSAYMLNLDGIKLHTHSDADFSFSGFGSMPGYAGKYGTITYHGALCANSLMSSGVIVDANG